MRRERRATLRLELATGERVRMYSVTRDSLISSILSGTCLLLLIWNYILTSPSLQQELPTSGHVVIALVTVLALVEHIGHVNLRVLQFGTLLLAALWFLHLDERVNTYYIESLMLSFGLVVLTGLLKYFNAFNAFRLIKSCCPLRHLWGSHVLDLVALLGAAITTYHCVTAGGTLSMSGVDLLTFFIKHRRKRLEVLRLLVVWTSAHHVGREYFLFTPIQLYIFQVAVGLVGTVLGPVVPISALSACLFLGIAVRCAWMGSILIKRRVWATETTSDTSIDVRKPTLFVPARSEINAQKLLRELTLSDKPYSVDPWTTQQSTKHRSVVNSKQKGSPPENGDKQETLKHYSTRSTRK